MCLKEALKKLGPFISERRKARIATVVANRSANISLLLENVNNIANEYAVLRSMEALGCLHLHKLSTMVQPQHPPLTNSINPRFPPRTDAGARGWVRIHHWYNTEQCISCLKEKHGYILAVANPTAQTSITNLDFSQKLLVAFGNEKVGISEELLRLSNVNFSLPMCGFVDSFNVSVAASLILYHAYLHRMTKLVSRFFNYKLTIICVGFSDSTCLFLNCWTDIHSSVKTY